MPLSILIFSSFSGNTVNWEQRQFMNVFSYLPNNTLSRSELSNEAGTVYNIHYGDILLKLAEYTNISETHLPSIKRSLIVKQYARNSLQDGDIVIADTAEDITAGRCIEIGNIGGKVIVAGLHAIPCRPKIEFGQAFLGFYMNSNAFRIQLFPLMQGIKVISISKSAIKNVTIRYPFLHAEQECIGSLFRCLDSLIAAAERKVLLLKKKKHAYLNHIFTQHLRFTGHTTPWQTKKLGDIYAKAGSGGTPSTSIDKYYNGNIPFLSIADLHGRLIKTTQKTITEEGLLHSAAWIVPQGSIALAMYASVGKVGILSRPMATSQAFYNMVFTNDSTRNFIFTYLEEMDLLRKWEGLVSTGTQRNLNAGKIQNLVIQIPEYNEQKQIARFFQTLDSLISAAERKVSLLKKKKQAYLQKMFI